jgi:hypothetical protein
MYLLAHAELLAHSRRYLYLCMCTSKASKHLLAHAELLAHGQLLLQLAQLARRVALLARSASAVSICTAVPVKQVTAK